MRVEVTVREAKPADARTIAEIHVAAWRAAYRGMIPDEYLASLSVEERTQRWSKAISAPGPAKVAVAHVQDETLGFCSFGPTRDEAPPEIAEIYSLNVRPDRWRRGAGRMLCEHAFRQAALREQAAITLWVLKQNERAQRFYERLGYLPDGAQKTDVELTGSPLHDLRYRKAI
ncbi:MAG TPA: GNAT family N-acetyltransferase [Burkholderiales bacterium]|nr:GNAT family N-acetyltransferase [Burkholderiales bacterium]